MPHIVGEYVFVAIAVYVRAGVTVASVVTALIVPLPYSPTELSPWHWSVPVALRMQSKFVLLPVLPSAMPRAPSNDGTCVADVRAMSTLPQHAVESVVPTR